MSALCQLARMALEIQPRVRNIAIDISNEHLRFLIDVGERHSFMTTLHVIEFNKSFKDAVVENVKLKEEGPNRESSISRR
jgi:hypothetical protein